MRPSFARAPWLVSGLFTLAVLLASRSAAAQFVSLPGNPRNILEGNWQSCQEQTTGRYAERVYDHVVNGVPQFEVHLGPRREFAISRASRDIAAQVDGQPDQATSGHAGPAPERWEIHS